MSTRPFRLALFSVVSLAGVAMALGCESARPPQVPLTTTQSGVVTVAAGVPLPSSEPLALDGTGREVRMVFAEWSAARARGDAAAFDGFYDGSRFEGVRWTRNGLEKRMTLAEWKAEQRPVLAAAAHTPPEPYGQPVFESWSGGTLDAATASVTFRDESRLVHVLTLSRGSDGRLRIMREEVGGSARGDLAGSRSLSRDAKVMRLMAGADK